MKGTIRFDRSDSEHMDVSLHIDVPWTSTSTMMSPSLINVSEPSVPVCHYLTKFANFKTVHHPPQLAVIFYDNNIQHVAGYCNSYSKQRA